MNTNGNNNRQIGPDVWKHGIAKKLSQKVGPRLAITIRKSNTFKVTDPRTRIEYVFGQGSGRFPTLDSLNEFLNQDQNTHNNNI